MALGNIRAMKKYIIICTALAALLLAQTACNVKSQTHLTTTAAGHSITADIDGVASLENNETNTVITTKFGSIVIDRSYVSLGSQKWTDIPEGVPITLNFSENKYSVQWTQNK